MDCLFCKIVKGEIPSFKIYEDESILAFLDIKPFTKGHCLVIPKQHFQDIFDISEEALQKVAVAGKHISEKIKNNLQADGIRLSQSNGKAAGQDIMHFHLHIIPRYEGEDIPMHPAQTAHLPQADFEELKKIVPMIKC